LVVTGNGARRLLYFQRNSGSGVLIYNRKAVFGQPLQRLPVGERLHPAGQFHLNKHL